MKIRITGNYAPYARLAEQITQKALLNVSPIEINCFMY